MKREGDEVESCDGVAFREEVDEDVSTDSASCTSQKYMVRHDLRRNVVEVMEEQRKWSELVGILSTIGHPDLYRRFHPFVSAGTGHGCKDFRLGRRV